MKKVLAIVLAVTMVLSLAACGKQAAPAETAAAATEAAKVEEAAKEVAETVAEAAKEAAPEKDHFIVGYNNYNMSTDFPQQLYQGIEDACKEAGIELMYAEAAGDPQKMVSNIDAFITAGCDAIIDFNFNPEVGATLVQMCNDANIPLFSIDCKYDGAYFFGVNNLKAGKIAGEFASKIAKADWDGSVDYLVLEWNAAAGPEVKQRLEGVVEKMKEDGIQLSDDQIVWIDYNNDGAKAQATAADFLTAHPDSKKIFFAVATDPAAAAVVAAIETVNRTEDVIVISHGGEDVGIEMLKSGGCYKGTVCYDPLKYGPGLIEALLGVLNGDDVPEENYSEQYVMTQDDVK